MKRQLIVFLGISLLLLNGCAVGNKFNYHDAIAHMEATNTFLVAIGTHDTRTYILNGKKKPDFVGLSRGGYGNPFNVTTTTGNALASDMSEAIKNSFLKNGYNAKVVLLEPNDDFSTAVDKLKASSAYRLVYFKLNKWKSDTFSATSLAYDVKLTVFDKNGEKVAEKIINGKDDLGGNAMNPPKHAKAAVPVAFSQKLEEMLNDPVIQKALL